MNGRQRMETSEGHAVGPVTRAARLTLVMVALAGCAMVGQGGAKDQLTKALEAHSETVRWGGMRGLENSTQNRVTDYEVRSVKFDNDEYTKATVRVEVQGYAQPKMTLQRWFLEQTWMEKSDGWLIVAEKEVKAPKDKRGRGTMGEIEKAAALGK